MASTGVGFRWLDILEKEFDKACVELDTSLSELETEEPEVVFSARQKIGTLSSCFAQLTHKALTIFQNSAKLEAELVDMRAELVQARAAEAAACEDVDDVSILELGRARAEAAQLAGENAALRDTVLALHSELFGARLATKYLDKELAGRIQQLQLLGRDMRAELRDSLWAQVEAEILLQRHKTLVRVCRGVSPRPAPLAAPAPRARARPRTVRVRRSPHLGLGISVTGGREHGVPILISELEAGGPAALTRELFVGDAILAINDVDLTQACHKEAVQALQSVKGDCALCVQFIATDDEDRLSEDNYRFPLRPPSSPREATPTAPRTPDYTRNESEAGSGSECSSPSRPPYPDYNSLNNNLNILDMDDDSIKIEARLEMVPSVTSTVPPPLLLPPAVPPLAPDVSDEILCDTVTYSPRGSLASTPVHTRKVDREKKRRPLNMVQSQIKKQMQIERLELESEATKDWRTKGAYRRVGSDDTTLSDDLSESPPSPTLPEVTQPTVPTVAPIGPMEPTVPTELKLPVQKLPPCPTLSLGPLIAPLDPEVSTGPLLPELPMPTVEPTRGVSKPRTNGEVKPRRESKGFRIGSARRVLEPAVNGERRPALVGDGDPDFGTPV